LSWATSFIASIITHPFYLVQHQKVKGNGGNAIPLPPKDGSLLAQLPMNMIKKDKNSIYY